jgi:hypothetical protein
MYVIYSIPKKCYVAAMGSKFGYTRAIFKARRYQTVDAARADCGRDERIERLPSWA